MKGEYLFMTFSLPKNTPQGQVEAILTNSTNITVEAGAGTGKTWVLTERYLRLLLEDKSILPSDILTLTYTEAAAGEMKNRITSRVEQALKNFDDNERKHQILDGLSDLWISTIHAFAARLIRESGLSLDIDPRAQVISTQQEQEFWDSIAQAADFANLREIAKTYRLRNDQNMNKKLFEIAESLDNDEKFSAGVAKYKAYNLSELARSFSEMHSSLGKTWQNMIDILENDTLIDDTRPYVKEILIPEWQKTWDIFSQFIYDNPDLPVPQRAKPDSPAVLMKNLLDSYRFINPDENTSIEFYSKITKAKGGTGKLFDLLKQCLDNETFGDWKKKRPENAKIISSNINIPLNQQELIMRNILLKFCILSWAMWDIMKTRRGLLSFSDMINHAVSTIKNGSNTRKFKHILVDEFQDTDRLQFNMIDSLRNNETSIFFVGDPKQSIYRFRYADPALFAQAVRASEKAVKLNVSFRTKSELLSRINNLFTNIWREGLGKSEAMKGLKYESLSPSENESERNSGNMPEFMVILAPHNSKTTQQGRKNLADELAKNISDWVKESRTIWDKKEKLIRPVKFSDFAILTPSRNIYPVIEESLEQLGIKSIQDKSTDYFSRIEINDVVCLLRAVADMNDDFSVIGWLMSPFSGVDENTALNVLKNSSKKIRPIQLIRENLPETYSLLNKYAVIGEIEGPAGLISIFDKNRDWLSCYSEIDRMRALRNIRLAVHIARNFQQSGTSSLSACAEWLSKSVKNEIEFEEPAWHDDNENAVRLGTVHSAKGLEYPVSIVFDPRIKKKSNSDSLRASRELGLVFTSLPDEMMKEINDKEFKPALSSWDSLLSDQGEEEEQARLFYVAATRAQDSLIYCGLIDEKEDGKTHDHTWTKLFMENDKPEIKYAYEMGKLTPYFHKHEEEEKIYEIINPVEAKISLRQFSASSFALFEFCPFAWRRKYRQGLSLTWQSPNYTEINDDDDSGGAELGSLAHWILSRWPEYDIDYMLDDSDVISQLPANLRRIWRKGNKEILREWLKNFAESKIGIILKTQKNISREKLFRIRLNESTSLAGAIDAVYENNIIDYKITSIDNVPPGLYESQLDFYALVLNMMNNYEKINVSTIFLREGKIMNRVCENFDEIIERVVNASQICASGPYTANTKNCRSCPFKKGCAKHE